MKPSVVPGASFIPEPIEIGCEASPAEVRLDIFISFPGTIYQDLKAVGVHFSTVKRYRALAASLAVSLGECAEQLSELHQHSTAIEKEIPETELNLASLKRNLASDRATIYAVQNCLQAETDWGASLRRGLDDLLSLHLEVKRWREAAYQSQEVIDAERKQLKDLMFT